MTLWLAAIAVLATVGFFLLIRVGLDDLAAIAVVLRKRLRRRIVLDRHLTPAGPTIQARTVSFHRSPLGLGLIVGLMLGSAWLSNPLLSVWFIIFGGLAGWVIQRSRP